MTPAEKVGALALGLAGLVALGIAALPAGALPGGAAAVTLASVSVALPDDLGEEPPAGPHADVFARNCTACHSTAMVLNQPRLGRDQWAASIKKMREAYRAPIAAADDAALLDYLVALSAGRR